MTWDQIAIAATGMFAIWLTQQRRESWKRYASILGLLGQPAWFYSSFVAEQWGIFAMCFVYTYAWLLGFYNHWVLPRSGTSLRH